MGSCGQAHDKRCALSADVVVAENFSAMLFHDPVADAKAEAGSLPDFFRCKEGIKNLVGMRNSRAIVSERYFYSLTRLRGHDLYARRAADGLHRVVGIVED